VRPCGAGEAAGEEEALAGMMSPSGYSSGDEPVPYATAAQAASIQARTRAIWPWRWRCWKPLREAHESRRQLASRGLPPV